MDQRPVTVAQRMGEDVVIGRGLSPGETVVTEGQLRLEQGTRVQLQGANAAGPGPADNSGRGRGSRGGSRGRGGQPDQGRQGS